VGHRPHLFVPGPWLEPVIESSPGTIDHLDRVLRVRSGDAVSYTDGAGMVGDGVWESSLLLRGPERRVSRPVPALTMAVAVPKSIDRQRFVVEKLGELGVARLCWLDAEFGSGHPRKQDKTRTWAVGALEQSRGAYLLEVGGLVRWDELERPLLVALPGADPLAALAIPPSLTVAIGPEGGFAATEIPADALPVGLGSTVLRVETAAVVAAAVLLARS
jgi:RsmE family RNA methyltransferase